ncbi:MAG: hypothetical protein KF841_06445 [Phycisphaerae bacterium]|nr:hypothetical protein [Phycisphaerae bacterium]
MENPLIVLDHKAGTHRGDGFQLGGCNPDAKCGNGLEKIYPTCAVRYGYMRYIGEFRYSPGMKFTCGGKVVIHTNRGIELGEQVSLTCSGCDKSVNRKQIMDYVRQSGPEFMQLKAGRILRAAAPADLDDQVHLNMAAAQKLLFARKLAAEQQLPMKFVTCEHLLGGERIIFHFMSEDRIDFRELVRVLAQEYHTRIEMHQVGARDEARLVADYEICGRECCCKNFLKKLRQVNMKMAKLQKATLDPSKVSGRCGRLRCCLRYEHEGYEELNRKLPRVGSRIRTAKGIATVRNRQILTQLLSVIYDGTEEWETIAIEDVIERGLPKLERPMEGPMPSRDQRSSRDSNDRRGRPSARRGDNRPSADRSVDRGSQPSIDRGMASGRRAEAEESQAEPIGHGEQGASTQNNVDESIEHSPGFASGLLDGPLEDESAVDLGSDDQGEHGPAVQGRADSGRRSGPMRGPDVQGADDAGQGGSEEQRRRRRRGRRRRGRRDGGSGGGPSGGGGGEPGAGPTG